MGAAAVVKGSWCACSGPPWGREQVSASPENRYSISSMENANAGVTASPRGESFLVHMGLYGQGVRKGEVKGLGRMYFLPSFNCFCSPPTPHRRVAACQRISIYAWRKRQPCKVCIDPCAAEHTNRTLCWMLIERPYRHQMLGVLQAACLP